MSKTVFLSYLGWDCLILTFQLWQYSTFLYRYEVVKCYFPLCILFSTFTTVQTYCVYFDFHIANIQMSLNPFSLYFTTTISSVDSTEANHPHFLCLSNLNRNFNQRIFSTKLLLFETGTYSNGFLKTSSILKSSSQSSSFLLITINLIFNHFLFTTHSSLRITIFAVTF